ncbi:VanZ family protein [Nocardiopsis mangrovi]|uniref:VanZ family protein n=1 Tax=Nocardiopsis mangrovi TaxID=1179818 RepID=A0ABV9DUN5_9ACTN
MAIAVPGVAFAVVLGSTLFLRRHFGGYGRIQGWQGMVTAAVLCTGIGLAAYAVWPLPRGIDGLCALDGGAPAALAPLARRPETWAAAADAAVAAAVFLPVGLLARYRYRRGLPSTLAIAALLAGGIELVQGSALLGAYPCPYRVAATGDIVLACAGAVLGWVLGGAAAALLPRAWPGAIADLMPPGLSRRFLGHALDVAMWWYGAMLSAGVAVAAGVVPPGQAGQVRAVLLLALAVAFGVLVPLLRTDRSAPGRAAVGVALAGRGRPSPAARWRAALRGALLYTPAAVLFAVGLPWWAAAVWALHGSCALVRRDQAGLFDLITGTRVVTGSALTGRLPDRLIRFTPARTPGAPANTA